MSELPEPIQFCLRTTERVSSSEPASLTPTELTISHAYTFDMEQQNGGLSQFFYNTDASAEVAEETARALDRCRDVSFSCRRFPRKEFYL